MQLSTPLFVLAQYELHSQLSTAVQGNLRKALSSNLLCARSGILFYGSIPVLYAWDASIRHHHRQLSLRTEFLKYTGVGGSVRFADFPSSFSLQSLIINGHLRSGLA